MKTRTSKYTKILSAALALVLGIGSVTFGASAITVGDYTNDAEKDNIEFYEFNNAYCPHETMSEEWMVETYPDGSTPGSYVLKCATCGAACESVEIPPLKIKTASLILTDSMAIDYKVSKDLLTEGSYTDPYVVFSMLDESVTVTSYREDENYFIFTFDNIAPQYMSETVTATLYATCYGKVCAGIPQDYSVKTYCYNTLAKYASDEYAELRTLLVDLLNYGTVSQQYTGRVSSGLANADLTDAQRAWGTAEDRALTTVQDTKYIERENATVNWKSAGLSLRESVALRFKIDAASADGLSARVVNANGVYTVPSSQFVETDGGYYVYFDHLTAANMSNANYITIYDANGPISNTFSYSVESYAYSMLSKTEQGLLVDLIHAMMRYGDAAKAYVATDEVQPEDNWTGLY
ncbi:MAG: hypothetical protein IKA76_00475 [Clostridia bacterium]|nr:hypothetical protein [Clostridia bacterium]